MNKSIFLLFIFILSIVSVYASPPFQTSEASNQLIIIYPKIDTFKLNTDAELHYHVINSSGYILQAQQVNCTAHVYNTTNNHIKIINLTNNVNTYDKDLIVNGSLLNLEGTYAVSMWCNSNNQAGYLSQSFYVTKDGKDITNVNFGLGYLVAIIGIGIVVFLLLYIAFNLNDEHFLLKTMIMIITLSFLILIPKAVMDVLGIIQTSNTFYNIYVRLVWIIFLYIIGYFVYKLLDRFGKLEGIKKAVMKKQ